MPSLPDELFSLVERKVLEARLAAEAAAEAAINALAVNRAEPYRTLTTEQRRLRNALRARARQLGGGSQHHGLPLLMEEIAYQQWHRMLFARFLADNGLLMHPTGIPVTLQDCAELAPEEGEPDAWSLAARYASTMLPGIFRQDDPVVQVRFAPEGRLAMEGILSDLPSLVFTADDSLGWMYQFWQSRKKDEVNASERKIGGADIAPVTQLFTEDYMVRFLLENTLGAWWAARHPESPLVKTFTYLRFREDGTPAAGTFPGWPDRAAQITVMDPCCGSGHFLVVAFLMLWLMRAEEEGIDEAAAADAVLSDNLFGLEIDSRCTQIAAFALALVAWKASGYRELPLPNIACSGIPVQGQLETWTELAGEDARLRNALEQLYELFKNAPDLGSLVSPKNLLPQYRMFSADYAEVEPLLQKVLAEEPIAEDPTAAVFGAAARGVARVVPLLARTYTLVTTNVPYLKRGNQSETLRRFCGEYHAKSKADLATVFIERCLAFCSEEGSFAIVTPQYWLFLVSYEKLRKQLLGTQVLDLVANLGTSAFKTISGEMVNVILLFVTKSAPRAGSSFRSLDASTKDSVVGKEQLLKTASLQKLIQSEQQNNPDTRIVFERLSTGRLLEEFAESLHGQGSFDDPCYSFQFWEMDRLLDGWILQQTTGTSQDYYSGCTRVFRWENGQGRLFQYMQAKAAQGYTSGKWKAGIKAWARKGVAVSGMRTFYVNLYAGESFDTNVAVLLPFNDDHLQPLWNYCRSEEFERNVRLIDRKAKVTVNTFLKVPFDLERWRRMSEDSAPLPKPQSNDPSQWLFDGCVTNSTAPLQVAMARLLGYRWLRQRHDHLEEYIDADGIVSLRPIAGELRAVERLRDLLTAAYGQDWSSLHQEELLASVGFSGKSLEEWLSNEFFAQHCRFFQNRPFIWHIWDGRRDGFSALVNYHKLDFANLNKLIYTYLGDWIRVQRSRRDAGEASAEGRLVAALNLQKRLEAIRDGEPPYDIYVRWKPLHEQPIGWNPDLNDGVRVNIRPFVTAGVLRSRFTINWNKDRGKNPDGSERLNDLHFTVAEKQEARRQWEASQRGQAATKQEGLL